MHSTGELDCFILKVQKCSIPFILFSYTQCILEVVGQNLQRFEYFLSVLHCRLSCG